MTNNFLRLCLGLKRLSLASTLICLGGAANEYHNLKSLEECVNSKRKSLFNDATISNESPWPMFTPVSKLYLYKTPTVSELAVHHEANEKIEDEKRSLFKDKEKLGAISSGWSYWLLNQMGICIGKTDTIGSALNQAITITDMYSELNNAILNFKYNKAPKALRGIDSVLNILGIQQELEVNTCQSELTMLDLGNQRNPLLAHAYNIKAKIYRKMEDVAQSDESYEAGLAYQPRHRIMIKSQIALWGDMFWINGRANNKVLSFLKTFDVSKLNDFKEDNKDDMLAMANLSWLFIQAAWHHEGLDLPQAKETYFNWAIDLTQESIDYEESLPNHVSNKEAQDIKSINAYLFCGIAWMDKEQSDYHQALDVFNKALCLSKDPSITHHPSLLRRRALVLHTLSQTNNTLKSEAYRALQQFLIEYQYRQQFSWKPPRASWKKEVATLIDQQVDTVSLDPLESQVIGYLKAGQYDQAYHVLKSLAKKSDWADKWSIWLKDYFKVVSAHSKELHNHYLISRDRIKMLEALGLDNTPPHSLLMSLSREVYQVNKGYQQTTPAGCVFIEDNGHDRKTAYRGAAYQYMHGNNDVIIIVHQGTDTSEWQHIAGDVEIGLGLENRQFKASQDFTRRIEAAYPNAYYIHTGHSLGGYLASLNACLHGRLGFAESVVFDAPSIWFALNRFNHLSDLADHEFKNFPVTSYLTWPSFINTGGGHQLGHVMRLQLPKRDSESVIKRFANQMLTWASEHYEVPADKILDVLEKTLSAHDKHRLEKSMLLYNRFLHHVPLPLEASYWVSDVLSWPKDLSEWRNFALWSADQKEDVDEIRPTASNNLNYQIKLRSFKEDQIPLSILPFELAEGLCIYFDWVQENSGAPLNHLLREHRELTWLEDIDVNVLKSLEFDKANDCIKITGPLCRYEIMAYLHQQIRESCGEGQQYFQRFYPKLKRIQACYEAIQPQTWYGSLSAFFGPAAEAKFNINDQSIIPKKTPPVP